MTKRLNAAVAAPEARQALLGVEAYIRGCGLEHGLIALVKMRASQINGCAYCLDMHSREARQHGETEQRLYLLNAWRESSAYTPRERAALAWTEALTRIAETHAPDDVYAEACRYFNEKEVADLTVAIGMINLWNRVSIAFRTEHILDARQHAA